LTASGVITANNGIISTSTVNLLGDISANTLSLASTGSITGQLTVYGGISSVASDNTFSGKLSITNSSSGSSPSTGALIVSGDIGGSNLSLSNSLKLFGSNSNYTGIQANTLSNNITFTLPNVFPVAENSYLISDTSGNLSYSNISTTFATKTFSGIQNVSSPADITGLSYTSGYFDIDISVNVLASSNLTELFNLSGVLSSGNGWDITTVSVSGDYTGVSFSIKSAGQLQYTSPSYTGFVSLTFSWTRVIYASGDNLDSGVNSLGTVPSNGAFFNVNNVNFNDTGTLANGTCSNFYSSYFAIPSLSAGNINVTTSNANNVVIAGPPMAGSNETFTNSYSLNVLSGNSLFQGPLISTNSLVSSGTTTLGITSVGTLTGTSATFNGNLTVTGSLNASSVTTTLGSTVLTSNLDMGNNYIINLANPVNPTDAANKQYVDMSLQGLNPKNSVIAGTVTSGTLSSSFTNGSIIDNVTLVTGDRILIKDQINQIENGIYIVTTGTPTRSSDFASGSSQSGAYTFVEQGTVNANSGFVCTSIAGSDIVGTNNITFTQFSGAGEITAGTGLSKSGNTLSVNSSQSQITSVGSLISLNTGPITGTSAVFSGNLTNSLGTSYLSVVNSNSISINGNTSGIVTLLADNSFSSYNFIFPDNLGSAGQVLTSTGSASATSWTSPITSISLTVPSVFSVTGSPLTANGTISINYSGTALPVLNGGTGVTTSTGSGSVVLNNSPTFITPILGAASATTISASGNISGSTLTSTVSTGNPPLIVNSSTNVANLNASSVNGYTFSNPGPIGGTTASTGAFTTVTGNTGVFSGDLSSSTGTVSGLISGGSLSVIGTSNLNTVNVSGGLSANSGFTSNSGNTFNTFTSTTGTFNGNLNMNGNLINNVSTPSVSTDAANKGYIDSEFNSTSSKNTVIAATVVSGTLSSSFTNGSTIDGVTLVTGNRVLIKNQVNGIENGIYIVTTGTPTRSSDYSVGNSVSGSYVFVSSGTVNSNLSFICTNASGSDVIGTNALTFSQLTGGPLTAGTGLSENSFVLSVNPSQLQITEIGTLSNLSVSGQFVSSTQSINGVSVTPNSTDIVSQISFSAANNVTIPANVTGLVASYTNVRSFSCQMVVSLIATTNLYEQFEFKAVQSSTQTGNWYFVQDSVGDNCGLVFSITSSGQVQYTSTNQAGFVSLTFKFKMSTITV
jgi:hypothetical protein